MKKLIYNILGLTVILALFFSACKKDEHVKHSEDYDYNAIEPIILNVYGDAAIIASGVSEYTYKVNPRGGSTYSWTVSSGGTITPVSGETWTAIFIPDQVSDQDSTTISVVETTMGGLTGDPKTMDITLLPFCPIDLNGFVGEYEEDDHDTDTSLYELSQCYTTLDPDDDLFGIIINDVLSGPYWFDVTGGQLKIKLNACDSTVMFSEQETGIVHPTYGMVSMKLTDDSELGNFNPDTKVIEFTGTVFVDAGSFGDYLFTYTPK